MVSNAEVGTACVDVTAGVPAVAAEPSPDDSVDAGREPRCRGPSGTGADAGGCEAGRGGGEVLMVTWMPPVHHVTGMSERLWQVAEKLLWSGYRVLVASEQCSAGSLNGRAHLDPR